MKSSPFDGGPAGGGGGNAFLPDSTKSFLDAAAAGPGGSAGVPGQSKNQYFPNGMPSMGQLPPGIIQQGPLFLPTTYGSGGNGTTPDPGYDPKRTDLGGGYNTVGPAFPGITGPFMQWLSGQIGQGVPGFNQATNLPSGGATQPGQLTAPLNPILQQLSDYFSGKGPAPTGFGSLFNTAQTGNPTNVMPAWDAMVASMQRNMQENAANLKEQFNFSGNLASSPMANAMTDYFNQASKDQAALLGQMQSSASEAAAGRQLTASEDVGSMGTNLGGMLQGLDQQSIQNLYNEFIRTQPQYNPLLSMMFSGATTFPPVLSSKYGLGVGGALLQNAGGIASGIADLYSALKKPPSSTGGGGGSLPTGAGGGGDPFSGFGFGG